MGGKKWLGGAVVASLALSLMLTGGVWAQNQERGAGRGAGGYGQGSGVQGGKQQDPAACKAEGPIAVCTPKSAKKKTDPNAGQAPETKTGK